MLVFVKSWHGSGCIKRNFTIIVPLCNSIEFGWFVTPGDMDAIEEEAIRKKCEITFLRRIGVIISRL